MWPTLSETFTYLGIDELSLTPEQLLVYTQEREIVIDSIESYCQRNFEVATEIEDIYMNQFHRKMYLKRWPIISITEIKDSTGEVLDANKYKFNSTNGYIERVLEGRNIPIKWPVDNFTIEYSGGFTDLPITLLSCYYDLFLFRYQQRQNANNNIDFGLVKRASIAGVASLEFNQQGSGASSNQNWSEFLKSYQDVLDYYASERAHGFGFEND